MIARSALALSGGSPGYLLHDYRRCQLARESSVQSTSGTLLWHDVASLVLLSWHEPLDEQH